MNKDKPAMQDILIVDDEQDIRKLMTEVLGDEGYKCREAANSDEALASINLRRPDLVILDIWLHGSKMDGMQILDVIMRDYADVPVLMISGHGNIETAVSAIKRGAYDFIEKPFKIDRLLLMVQRALESSKLKRENKELKRSGAADNFQLTGKSNAVNAVVQVIARAAPTSSRVLIRGLPGSGKEVAARMLHAKSRRADGPFVIVNCATLRADQFEQELFGAEATASSNRKIGLFEQANGGTLVLDEIADMPLETQGKIVRVLHDLTFVRIGGTTKVECDVRVVATTNKNPEEEMEAGRLRQDLYYRLSVVPIMIPSLAERRDDIPMLARHFLQRAAEIAGLTPRELGEDALAALQAYTWPGNVRQLRNAMEWVLIMASGDSAEPIRADQLPPDITNSAPHVLRWEKGGEIMALPLRDAREMFEREYLLAQVTRFGGNISRTANFVGMERSALHRKLKLLGVHGGSLTHEGSDRMN